MIMHRLLIVLFAVGCRAAVVERPAPDPAAGLAPRPDAAARIGGRDYPVDGAWVTSEDNLNRRWAVVLASHRPFPAEPITDLSLVTVEVAGVPHAVRAVGGDPRITLFELAAEGLEIAGLARRLGVEPRPRQDPGLRLEARLEPVPEAPRHLTFTVRNLGSAPFEHLRAGQGMGAGPDPGIELRVERNGVPLAIREPRIDFGGLGKRRRLAPDESERFGLDLEDWFGPLPPGHYRVAAVLHLVIEPTSNVGELSYARAHGRWDQSVAAECSFEVP